MCIKCDGYSDEEIMRGIDLTIQVYGFYIQGVVQDPDGPGNWSYTIGLTDFGLPELVLADVPFDDAMQRLNEIGPRVIAGEPLASVLTDLDYTLGPVHYDHLNGDLIVVWVDYYLEMRVGNMPTSAEFLQLIPGPSHGRSGAGSLITDLSRSC